MFELLLLILGAVFVKKQILDKPQAFTPAPRPVLRPNPRPVPVNRGGFLPSPQPVAPPSPIPQYQPWQAPTPAPEAALTEWQIRLRWPNMKERQVWPAYEQNPAYLRLKEKCREAHHGDPKDEQMVGGPGPKWIPIAACAQDPQKPTDTVCTFTCRQPGAQISDCPSGTELGVYRHPTLPAHIFPPINACFPIGCRDKLVFTKTWTPKQSYQIYKCVKELQCRPCERESCRGALCSCRPLPKCPPGYTEKDFVCIGPPGSMSPLSPAAKQCD